MNGNVKPNYRRAVLINDYPLAMALVCRGHNTFKAAKDQLTGKTDWLFDYSDKLMGDVNLYELDLLEVNAQEHYRVLIGEDDEYDEDHPQALEQVIKEELAKAENRNGG